MWRFLRPAIVGLSMTVLGFGILFGSIDGWIPMELAAGGFAMIILGPLTILGGLVAYILRRPTPEELAKQKVGDYANWHFRLLGILIVIVLVAGFHALGNSADQYVPGAKRPLS